MVKEFARDLCLLKGVERQVGRCGEHGCLSSLSTSASCVVVGVEGKLPGFPHGRHGLSTGDPQGQEVVSLLVTELVGHVFDGCSEAVV